MTDLRTIPLSDLERVVAIRHELGKLHLTLANMLPHRGRPSKRRTNPAVSAYWAEWRAKRRLAKGQP